ncbi:WXG100 family type VII secretion target [Streptomyces sp. WAC 04229]|uniref:WXG100 family type VII secretion target n=1 Tax=Streptomyces sp. WAC 04229 TaxID=2203206 RepID=UPI003D765431
MGEQPGPRQPRLARTDFESMTHEQLAALLDSASPESASHLATKLTKAASTITKIGDDLMTHTKGLEWQGEAGDTFRDWGGQAASSTLRLGQYAEVASRWMATVAQAVVEAKAALPDTSETTQAKADLAAAKKTLAAAQEPGAHNDPDARKLAQTAQTDATSAQQRMEAARGEAVQQLRKLAQTYEYSAQQVNSVEPPTFSPPAQHMDRGPWETTEYVSVVPTGASGPGAGSGSSGPGGPGQHGSDSSIRPGSRDTSDVEPLRLGSEPVERTRPVALDLNSLATLPDRPTPTPTPTATPQPGPNTPLHRFEAPLRQPAPVPPVLRNSGGGSTNPTGGRIPPTLRSPLPPAPGPGAGNARIPPVRDSGITGGKPVAPTTGRPSGGIPRGNVIGGQVPQGRAPMVRGLTPGLPGGPSTGQSGAATGRRLASQTGGVVGGGHPPLGRTGTAGGTGLVRPSGAQPARTPATGRPATVAGAVPRTGNAASRQRDERETERPDYLSEDEETWQRRRRPLPPVVE